MEILFFTANTKIKRPTPQPKPLPRPAPLPSDDNKKSS